MKILQTGDTIAGPQTVFSDNVHSTTTPYNMIQYEITHLGLSALKSWREGHINLAHGTKIEKNKKINLKQKTGSSEEMARLSADSPRR